MSLISSSQKPLLLLLDCFTYILEGKMFNLSFPPPDILGKEKRRNIQHQIYLSSPLCLAWLPSLFQTIARA